MTATRSSVDYTVRELTAADELTVLSLLSTALAGGPTGERTAEFFRWKHRENPFGPSLGLGAFTDDGDLAAVRLLLRWGLLLDGAPVRAVRAVDTATHPSHQGRGLFRRLTLEALDTVAGDTDLVFNTPNDASRPGYLKMGWHPAGDVPIAVRPVRPLRFLRGVRASGQDAVHTVRPALVSPLPRLADVMAGRIAEVRALADATAAGRPPGRLHTDWSSGYLQWRYASAPGLDYRAVPVEQDGRLVGLGIGRLRWRGALRELTLAEVLMNPGDSRAARRVLHAATRAGVDHVATHLTPGTALPAAGRARGYLRVPGRGLTLVVNPRRALAVDPAAQDSWSLALGDLEVF